MTQTFETDFDEWFVGTFDANGPFTVLFVLVAIGETHVDLLRSAFLHVIGDEMRWPQMAFILDSAKVNWSGVVFFRAGR